MVDASAKPQVVEQSFKSLTYTVYDVKFVPSAPRVLVLGIHARGTGAFQVFELNEGQLSISHQVEKASPFKCGTFHASDGTRRHVATGQFDGSVALWDLDRVDAPVYNVKGHSSIINAIDGCGGILGAGAPEIVTGSRDGCIKVWDPRQTSPVVTLELAKEGSRDCWTVAFGNAYAQEERIICAGYDTGDIKLFDLRTNTLLWESNIGVGICDVQFDRKDIAMNKLLVTGIQGVMRVYDVRTHHPTKGFAFVEQKLQETTLWCGRHLPQNRDIFMVSGGNGNVNLFKYSYPKERSKKDGDGKEEGVAGTLKRLQSRSLSSQPITSLDWNRDIEGLCVMGALEQAVRVAFVSKTRTV